MADSSDGMDLAVENNLGMVLEEDGVTLINSPCLGASSIILTDATTNGALNVSHYIIPQEVTVAGFEEVVGEVGLASPWGSLTSNSSAASLGQDSGIESDANPDVFFAFVDETVDAVSPMTLLTQVPSQEKSEVIIQKLYEMKDDLILSQEQELNEKNNGLNKIKISQHQIVKLVFKDEVERDILLERDREQFKVEKLFSEDEFLLQDVKKSSASEDDEELNKLKGSQNLLMYHCTECNTNFSTHTSFKTHMEDHLTRLQNSCALCSREFGSKTELQEHIKVHFTKNSFSVCEICKKEFLSKSVLKRHKKQMHEKHNLLAPLSHKCDVCNSVFSSKFSLKSHSATHSTRKPYTCKECGATFTQNGSLQVHLRRHRGEKPFKCVICGNTFTRAHSLKVHMKTHTGEKPYSCEYCGACFVTSSHLTVHRRTHTGERPYSCNSCGATFITTSHLNVHRRLHNANNLNSISSKASTATSPNNMTKSFSCSFCGATFDDVGKLRRHRRNEHKGTEKTEKPNCVMKCKEKDTLVGDNQINNQIVDGCS